MLGSDTLLVTDDNHADRSFARQAGISHDDVHLRAGERVRGAIHVQSVNACHSRFHTWLLILHGVATHDLPNDLGWRWAIDQQRTHSPQTLLRATISGPQSGSSILNGDSAHGNDFGPFAMERQFDHGDGKGAADVDGLQAVKRNFCLPLLPQETVA